MKKNINKLSRSIEKRMNNLGLFISDEKTIPRVLTFAEVSFALPRFIEDEKGNIYKSGMAQSISWTQDNREGFLPFYVLFKGKERRYKHGSNGGYLNAVQNLPGHWISDTEYNAKASLLCWLIKRGYMTVSDVFERLKNGTEKKDYQAPSRLSE